MADKEIKKVKIDYDTLPDINPLLEGHIVRYRIISEDKNRTSHWSPTHLVKPDYTYVTGNIKYSKSGDLVNIVWDSVKLKKDNNVVKVATEYDVWVRWDKGDSGDWDYVSRSNGSSISVLIPDTYFIFGIDQEAVPNKLSIEIYLKGSPILRDVDFLKVYEGGPWTV